MNQKFQSFKNNFSKCYKRYAEKINLFLYKYTRNFETARDITNEIFLHLYRKKHELDPDNPFTLTYLFKIARNKAIDFHRKEKKTIIKSLDAIEESRLCNKTLKDLENSVIEGEIIDTLHRIINSFPEEDKEIYIKKNIDGSTYKEICVDTKKTYHKVNKTIKQINHKIKEDLAKYYSSN